jgi:hypothetical protein
MNELFGYKLFGYKHVCIINLTHSGQTTRRPAGHCPNFDVPVILDQNTLFEALFTLFGALFRISCSKRKQSRQALSLTAQREIKSLN